MMKHIQLIFCLVAANSSVVQSLSHEDLISLHERLLTPDQLESFHRRLRGRGGGGGGGGGPYGVDMLFDNAHTITRVTYPLQRGETTIGIEAITTSTEDEVVTTLQEHVLQMKQWVDEGRMVRSWDPLFEELVENHNDIDMKISNTEDGVHVLHAGKTKCAVQLVVNHGLGLDSFVEKGWSARSQSHSVPGICERDEGSEPTGFDGFNDPDEIAEPVSLLEEYANEESAGIDESDAGSVSIVDAQNVDSHHDDHSQAHSVRGNLHVVVTVLFSSALVALTLAI